MGKVNKVLKDIFQSVVILPLTAGNMLGGNINRPYHDGRISTIVTVGCLLSGIVVVLMVHINKPTTGIIPLVTVKVLLATLIFVGFVSMIVLGIKACKNRYEVLTDYAVAGRVRIKIKFLWLFGIMSNLYSGFAIGLYVECMNKDQIFYLSYHVKIFYSCLLIVFHTVQIVFISYFSRSRFMGSVTSHYCIMLLLASNGAIWFFTFLKASDLLFIPRRTNTTDGNLNSNGSFHNCFGNSSSFLTFLDQADPILYPGVVAFSLLSVCLLLSMWSSTENPDIQTESENENALGYTELNDSNSEVSDESVLENRLSFRFRNGHSISYYTTIVIGIIVNLPYILGVVLLVHSNDSVVYNLWESYKCSFKILLWILSLIGFYKLRMECRPPSIHTPLEGNEYILLFSTFADAMFHTFGLLAGILASNNIHSSDTTNNIVVIENVVNLLIDYFQTVFIIQGSRYEKTSRNNLNWPIENVCLLLCILNLGQWLIDSFAGKRYRWPLITQDDFYGPDYWYSIMHVIFPVAVFFRFQSFTGMYSLYDKYKPR